MTDISKENRPVPTSISSNDNEENIKQIIDAVYNLLSKSTAPVYHIREAIIFDNEYSLTEAFNRAIISNHYVHWDSLVKKITIKYPKVVIVQYFFTKDDFMEKSVGVRFDLIRGNDENHGWRLKLNEA